MLTADEESTRQYAIHALQSLSEAHAVGTQNADASQAVEIPDLHRERNKPKCQRFELGNSSSSAVAP